MASLALLLYFITGPFLHFTVRSRRVVRGKHEYWTTGTLRPFDQLLSHIPRVGRIELKPKRLPIFLRHIVYMVRRQCGEDHLRLTRACGSRCSQLPSLWNACWLPMGASMTGEG